ncbi:MAG: isocitrate lyase/phosphoenolpyruvate mutase family protein [Gemmatimonadaceae bacterium]
MTLTPTLTPTLSQLLQRKQLVRAMAAHSPLSAILAQEAGFNAIWASGFELSALYGVADASLLSMTDHLAMVRAMIARCSLPIIADIDTGFGNAINVIHAVKAYEKAGAAAVVIEDKMFPKMTSLRDNAQQPLVRIEEFVGKIEAAIYARKSADFLIVARTEALIAGLGEEEALRRAKAYEDAGADIILVHSKEKTPTQIESFVARWSGARPLAVVPTSYPQLSERQIVQLEKIGVVIYGNHGIRASVTAMRDVFRAIAQAGSAEGVEQKIATVGEIFSLQEMESMAEHEQRFLR